MEGCGTLKVVFGVGRNNLDEIFYSDPKIAVFVVAWLI
jgi:hypothetical protein